MSTFLVLDIPKVPSDSTIWELHKSIFGIFGIKNLSRLDSRDMCAAEHCWPPLGAIVHCWVPLRAAGHICANFAIFSCEPLTMLNRQFVAGEHGLFGGYKSEDIRTFLYKTIYVHLYTYLTHLPVVHILSYIGQKPRFFNSDYL